VKEKNTRCEDRRRQAFLSFPFVEQSTSRYQLLLTSVGEDQSGSLFTPLLKKSTICFITMLVCNHKNIVIIFLFIKKVCWPD